MTGAEAATLVEQFVGEQEPRRRQALLAKIEYLTARAKSLDAALVPPLVESLRRERADAGAAPAELQAVFGHYEAVLAWAGPAAGEALRALLVGPPLRLVRAGEWCGGAKLVALAVLTPYLVDDDAAWLGALARSSVEPLPVRHVAGRLWHRVAGEAAATDLARLALLSLPEEQAEHVRWLAELKPALLAGLAELAREPRGPAARIAALVERLSDLDGDPLAGPRDAPFHAAAVELSLARADVVLDPWKVARWRKLASEELMEWLCQRLSGGPVGLNVARAMAAIQTCPGPRRWLRAHVARLVEPLLAADSQAREELVAVVAACSAVPAEVCRALLARLRPSPRLQQRDRLLALLSPSLTDEDGPLLAELATNPHNPPELCRAALRRWFELSPDDATPAVRLAALRGELDVDPRWRRRPDHLDWLLASLGLPDERQRALVRGWLVVDCGAAAVERLAAVVVEDARPLVVETAAAALKAIDRAAWLAAEAERASRARGLSRSGRPPGEAERGLSRVD